jgi:glutamate/tyrosine decarboxylase-like PLP-dependent enzyme
VIYNPLPLHKVSYLIISPYLTDQASITLNFSRGASHVIAQYYQLLRLGREGYVRIMNNLDIIAHRLGEGILATGGFRELGSRFRE